MLADTATAALSLGLVLGVRHALEADHLVAVSNLVTGQRHLGRCVAIGSAWAAGHTATLALVSGLVVGLEWTVEARLTVGLELLVSVVIVFLGGRLLVSTWRGGHLHAHPHRHGLRTHTHMHVHTHGLAHDHDHPLPPAGSRCSILILPLVVGAVHGLGGSGAVTILLAATRPDLPGTLAFLAVFGLGSAMGMALMSVLIALPTRWSARHENIGRRQFQTALALASIGFGIWLAATVVLTAHT